MMQSIVSETKGFEERLAALAALLGAAVVGCWCDEDCLPARRFDDVARRLERLGRHDPVDVCRVSMGGGGSSAGRSRAGLKSAERNAPVRMVWKADSTLDASKAEVSMNDRPFSATPACQLLRLPWRTVTKTHWQSPWPRRWGRREDASNRSCFRRA